MVSSLTTLISFIDDVEQKLIRNSVYGKSWVKEFLKGLPLDLFYLIPI